MIGPLSLLAMGETASALSWAGAGVGALGSLMAGSAESRSLRSQAKAVEMEAEDVRRMGHWDQIRLNELARSALSTQRQLFGQAGVEIEGTPMQIMRRTKQELVLERMMQAQNVERQVHAMRIEASELRKAARAAKRGGLMGAFSSFF